MQKIEIDSGRSSSMTHRITQASTTLNRRYVKRPSNIVIEEAAKRARQLPATVSAPAAPSRLVNLRVSSAALEAARQEEAAAKAALAESADRESAPERIITPKVLEFGRVDDSEIQDYADDYAHTDDNENTAPDPSIIAEEVVMAHSALVETSPEAEIKIEDTPEIMENPEMREDSLPLEDASLVEVSPIQSPTENYAPEETSAIAPEASEVSVSPEIDTSELAMQIAADYAAASLGASIKEYGEGYSGYALGSGDLGAKQSENTSPIAASPSSEDSVDAIARAASEAIASIRSATAPDEISEQVSSLKAFAENIKSNQTTPEMRELGDTIDKFVNIAMKSTKFQESSKSAAKTSSKPALSPKAHRAAAKVTKSSAKVIQANSRNNLRAAKPHPVAPRPTNIAQSRRKATYVGTKSVRRGPSLNNREYALESAMQSVASSSQKPKKAAPQPVMHAKRKGATKRFVIAIACAIACVAGVAGFVMTNMPDISVRVAAMQTGIEASYPSYIPRDYSLSDINSEDGKITMRFTGPDDGSFTLIEEKSSWDSSALLRNYVEPTWKDQYTTTHEQGITIYISNAGSNAAWVNGGVLYKINSANNSLTKKQVRNIVVSL